jgi:hypothetical protein
VEQDPIRLKNLLKTAQSLLGEQYPSSEVRALLDPLAAHADSRYQMDGIALFCSPDFFADYHIPMTLPELAVVADSFHIKPLIRFLQTNQRFFVLSLSQKRVALYQGSRYSMGPVNLAELPSSMSEALGIERQQHFLNVRTLGPNTRNPIFHGHGAPDTEQKDDLARFFRAIDSALWEFLRDDSSPLILAGVDYYFPLYRQASRTPNLVDLTLSGNIDGASPADIHNRAWPLIEKLFMAREQQALAAYDSARAQGLGVQDLNAIARFAVQGRVRQLMLSNGAHVWGRLERETGDLSFAAAQQDAKDDDILDDLAETVLVRGGEVLIVSQNLLSADAAAILRW